MHKWKLTEVPLKEESKSNKQNNSWTSQKAENNSYSHQFEWKGLLIRVALSRGLRSVCMLSHLSHVLSFRPYGL